MNKKYKLGVVGRPIEHSLSPFIHSRFSRNENINIEYLPYKVDESDFEIFIKEFFSDKDSKGLNVTLPYKKNAANLNGNISSEAKYINAVNTLVKSNGELSLYSTDGKGFINDIDSKGLDLKNKKVLMIGAGAAIESVLYRVAKSSTKSITLFNRTEEKANRLIRKFSNMGKIDLFHVFTNSNTYFYDLNYSLTETPFCKWASENSKHVFDGIGMLVYQAAFSFEKWFDVFPETDSVISDLEGMRE